MTWLRRRAGSPDDLITHLSPLAASQDLTVVGFFKVKYLLLLAWNCNTVGVFLLQELNQECV